MTKFPDLPKLPDPSLPIKNLVQAVTDLTKQGEETLRTVSQLRGNTEEGRRRLEELLKQLNQRP